MLIKGKDIPKSRHPHIIYWFWGDGILENEKYLRDIDIVSNDGTFNTMVLSARDGMDFWLSSLYPFFEKAVAYAHEKGIKIVLQLWPKGFLSHIDEDISLEEMSAVVNEGECTVKNGKAYYIDDVKHTRYPEYCPPEVTKLTKAYAFRKLSDGVYMPQTLIDVTDRAVITKCNESHIEISFDLPEYEEYTVYVMTAHYHRAGDLHSPYYIRSYREFIDRYSDIPFDGIVLDEFKNLPLLDFKSTIRERYYGMCFKENFEKETGFDLDETMFEMRYSSKGDNQSRPAAINRYFDFLRRSTTAVERFVAEYTCEIFGQESFLGVHNTFHNSLNNDEIYATGCNWWNLPRRYAQTDEDISYPVRMGIACNCPETIIYDMYYHTNSEAFYEKAMRDAKYGCRIHYHAMNDYCYGVDVGSPSFLQSIHEIEQKIDLLNLFDTVLPEMDILVVFGFPALTNWYPDESARSDFDLNQKINIMQRVDALWNNGYLNALVPDDEIVEGRIVLNDDNTFSYGGHKFRSLLYLYPQYGKRSAISWLIDAIKVGAMVKIIGNIDTDFDGNTIDDKICNLLASVSLSENEDIGKSLGVKPNKLVNGCFLSDGSVVFSDVLSILTHSPAHFSVPIKGHLWEGEYEGIVAIRADCDGNLERMVCGNCHWLTCDGKKLFSSHSGEDIAYL